MKDKSIRPIIIGVITLVIVYLITSNVVKHYRPPGSMTVIEAQAMDMKAMSANTPLGSIPVAAEDVAYHPFAPTVTYTGTVVAFNDSEIYSRVTGTLTAITVYPGDRVRTGQVVARLDSAELASKTNEAAAGLVVMQHDVMIAREEQRMAEAQTKSLQAKARAMSSGETDAQAQASASDAARDQSEHELQALQLSLVDTEANVKAMEADADYWKAEISREKQLLQAKAVSREEYDRESAQAKTADAKLVQARTEVREKRVMIAAAKSKVQQSEANRVSAQAKLELARNGVQAALADVAAAKINTEASTHRILHHDALATQALAQKRTADIIQSYTEIRAMQDGVVTERLVSPGTLVQPGIPILKIKSTDKVRLQANVSQSDLSDVHIGSAVTVSKPYDPSFHLQTNLTSIFNAANAQTRTVTIEALTPNPGGKLLPGEYIVMEIATATPRNAVTIPLEAVQHDVDQHSFVWTLAEDNPLHRITQYTCVMHPEIIRDKPGKCPICSMELVPKNKSGKFTAHRTFISLGASDGKRSVFEKGLQIGKKVITRGMENLNEGDPVSPVEWNLSGPKSLPQPSGEMPSMPGMDMGGTDTHKMPGMNMGKDSAPMRSPDTKNKNDSMDSMPGMGRN